jgi:aryl-phospho-beta-D-glucosidase BglC (GH1 family)
MGIERVLAISLSAILFSSVVIASSSPADAFTGNCANIAVKNFKGVNFIDETLRRNQPSDPATPSAYVAESMKYIEYNGLNAIRVPYYWEAYVFNPTAFMNEIDLIAKTAQQHGICVIFSNFHYYTSSHWNFKPRHLGFPSFVVDDFPKKATYIETAGAFWNAFLSNNIEVNGKKVWTVQFEFIAKVVNKVKGYNSVAGFEILNEPHLFSKTMYDKLGNYHTYMAKQIRAITDKKIMFSRETTWGFTRDPNLEYKIVPDGVSKLVYGPSLYTAPYAGSQGIKQINNFKTWSEKWGTEVLVKEWAADTYNDAVAFLKAFKANGFGWTWQSWVKEKSGGLGESLYQSDTAPRTEGLKILVSAMKEVY